MSMPLWNPFTTSFGTLRERELADARKASRQPESAGKLAFPSAGRHPGGIPFLYVRSGADCARVVSRHDFGDFQVENVIFESWEFVDPAKARAIYPEDTLIHAGMDDAQAKEAFRLAILAD